MKKKNSQINLVISEDDLKKEIDYQKKLKERFDQFSEKDFSDENIFSTLNKLFKDMD